MLTNKAIFFLLFLLLFCTDEVRGQPDLEPESVAGISLNLKDHKKRKVSFYSKDSLIFYSKNKICYFYINVLRKQANDSLNIYPLYLGNSESKGSCTPNEKSILMDNCFAYEEKSDIYSIYFTFFKHKNYSETYDSIYIHKSVIELNYFFKRKKMKVLIDFTDSKEQFLRSDITISFQEGVFEIKDPKEPKLIPIKKSRE